jgi:hypothetical protein
MNDALAYRPYEQYGGGNTVSVHPMMNTRISLALGGTPGLLLGLPGRCRRGVAAIPA